MHRALLRVLGLVAVAVWIVAGQAEAQRASSVQLAPDSRAYLINKDVGPDRWAISFDLATRTVTGNVFKTDGSPPSFIWCEIQEETPSAIPPEIVYTLDCFGADACESAPCPADAWTLIADDLEVTGSFLLPDGTRSTLGGNVQPILDRSCASSQACHTVGGIGRLELAPGFTWPETFRVPAAQVDDGETLYVDPFRADASYVVRKVRGTGLGARMPLGEPPLSDADREAIERWILEGAADN